MKTKEQRYNELYSSGLVDSIKTIFANRSDISEDYYVHSLNLSPNDDTEYYSTL